MAAPQSDGANRASLQAVRAAALSRGYVSMGSRRLDSVHEFYRYPARFSPAFAKAVIEAFSEIGDVVLDPFVGGGTTLVESRLLSRIGLGADISSLATFVSRAKTTLASREELVRLKTWASGLDSALKLRGRTAVPHPWEDSGYLRGLGGRDTWRIRDVLVRALAYSLEELGDGAAEVLGRCALLRTAQWALDMRSAIPSVAGFREALIIGASRVADVAGEYAEAVTAADQHGPASSLRTTVIHQGVPGLAAHPAASKVPPASLVLMSPPYPGVYVLYHRWKLQGRKEIAAPFWLTGSPDGQGMAHYTMSARSRQTLDSYFEKMALAFADVVRLTASGAWVVQLIGFNHVDSQLPRYLKLLDGVGLEEVRFDDLSTANDGRLWRSVPSRRWWVTATSRSQVAAHTAEEVVLVHRRKDL